MFQYPTLFWARKRESNQGLLLNFRQPNQAYLLSLNSLSTCVSNESWYHIDNADASMIFALCSSMAVS